MDGAAHQEMLDDLRQIVSAPGGEDFSRQTIIKLIKSLKQHLDAALETPLGSLEDGTEVVGTHLVVDHLSALVSALRDLDIGLTDPVFEPYKHGANATLPWRVRDEDAVLVEALSVFQIKMGIATQKEAAREMAALLNKHGQRRRGKRLSGRAITALKHRLRKR